MIINLSGHLSKEYMQLCNNLIKRCFSGQYKGKYDSEMPLHTHEDDFRQNCRQKQMPTNMSSNW